MVRRGRGETNGRSEALRILDVLETGRGHSHSLLARLPASLDERERRLATELVYGVLRRRAALDRVIARHASRPLDRVDPTLRNALRLSLYQIRHLTRVPIPAAVDEGVRLVRSRLGRSRAAFANAVLRAACRDKETIGPTGAADGPQDDAADGLAREHSFPRFLVERFLRRYGTSGTAALLETMNRPAPSSVRIRAGRAGRDAWIARLRADGIDAEPSRLLSGALRILRGAVQHSAGFRGGELFIQDEASQLVIELLRPIPDGSPVIDLCAAPGGKILAIAEALPRGAPLPVAADRSAARLRLLRENAERSRSPALRFVVMDARRPALLGRFERVLLDAPCSGTGIIRRHPEIRWRRGEAQIREFALKQEAMLDAGWSLVDKGGRLVYAVCSLEPEEGRERIAELTRAHREAEVVDARTCLPAAAHPLVTEDGFLETLPHRDDLDGFFAAVLRRR